MFHADLLGVCSRAALAFISCARFMWIMMRALALGALFTIYTYSRMWSGVNIIIFRPRKGSRWVMLPDWSYTHMAQSMRCAISAFALCGGSNQRHRDASARARAITAIVRQALNIRKMLMKSNGIYVVRARVLVLCWWLIGLASGCFDARPGYNAPRLMARVRSSSWRDMVFV